MPHPDPLRPVPDPQSVHWGRRTPGLRGHPDPLRPTVTRNPAKSVRGRQAHGASLPKSASAFGAEVSIWIRRILADLGTEGGDCYSEPAAMGEDQCPNDEPTDYE
jgi:hypothetical protein